jgi:hypothetical protein
MVWHARGVLVAALTLTVSGLAHAQNRSQGAPAPSAPSPRASAPIDLTGYWVAIVTQDWRQRMVTPPRGDYASVPLNVAAKKVADMWDPDQPVPADELCRAYGAPAIMRQPTRVHITWQDETTLKVETDAGMQTRLFYFGGRKGPKTAPSWQGDSTAEWDTPPAGRGGSPAKTGSLKVTTTNLRPGFLRKNGIPFSAGTSMTEHWDVFKERNGDQVMLITTTVTDPMYLREPWITALHFKKEADGSKWDPTPCSAK